MPADWIDGIFKDDRLNFYTSIELMSHVIREHFWKAALCPICDGEGQVHMKGYSADCPDCHGRGFILPETRQGDQADAR